MVAAARPGFDPYDQITVEAGSIFGGIRRTAQRVVSSKPVRVVARPAGAAFRTVAASPVGKPVIAVAKIATMPVLTLSPGASEQVDRGLDALSRRDLRTAGRAAVSAGVQLAPIVQQQLKQFGPLGLVASGAIGALATGVKGGNMEEIAWAAAEGAAPQGIDTAIRMAHEIRRGGSPSAAALAGMAGNLIPGSPAASGFNEATTLLANNSGHPTGEIVQKLGVARRALPNEQARRGFDLAIGTISRAAKGTSSGRALPLPRVEFSPRARQPMSALGGSHELASSILQSRPELQQASLSTVVRTLGIKPVTARRALSSVSSRYRWRPLTSAAARFVQRHAPAASRIALRDTSGLSDANTIYVVEPNDGPQRIGDKLLGPGQGVKRWRELIRANPQKKVDPKTGNFVILPVGARLNLPASWTAEINARLGSSSSSSSSTPVVVVPSVAPAGPGRFVVVPRGAGPFQIAALLTGDGNRRKELVAANVPRDADGRPRKSDGAGGFSPGLNPGERLFVPASWPAHPLAVPFASPAPTLPGALPTVPLPVSVTPAPPAGPSQDVTSILQAKAILAAWGKTDGLNEAGLTDYGARAEDLTPAFGPRDRFMLASFVSWSNRTQRTNLAPGGDLLPEHAEALRAWAERRSGLPVPPSSPSPTLPPVVALPTLPGPPGSTPPSSPAPSSPAPSSPAPPASNLPGPPAGKTASDTKSSSGGTAALLAIGIPLAAALFR